jgi:hypothetical protein
MCGIVGIINGKKDRKARGGICSYLRDAIVANSLRGFDSTGLVQATKSGKHLVYTTKQATDGTAFVLDSKNYGYLRDADDSPFTFVHNRAATRGEVTEENAHPFQHTNAKGEWLIGCHNGTLNSWGTPAGAHKVDSDWALEQIANDGLDAFEKFDGAYAFVWYGHREGTKTINIARNSARPMFVAYVKDEDRMLFASEYLMIVWLAQRNGISLEEKIIDLQPGYLYQFDVDNPREFKKTHLPAFRTKPRHEILFEALDKIFASARKEEKKQTKKEKVVHLLPKPKDEKKKGDYVSPEEVRLGKALELNGQVVDMTSFEYLAKERELWGVTQIGPDLFSCMIRNVDKATADTWAICSGVQGKVVGARGFDSKGMKEAALIISRNITVSENPELTALANGVGSIVEEFMTGRNNEQRSIH